MSAATILQNTQCKKNPSGNNNGQAMHGASKHAWRTQAAWANSPGIRDCVTLKILVLGIVCITLKTVIIRDRVTLKTVLVLGIV